ncbi:MAG: DMT family transporter [Alphaproteobacteria bacterium]|nr:DMT family transporter [Alphaproteobacteria bacterium]
MLPATLPFVFAIFWAASYVAAKIGLADISPYALVGIRLAIAAAAAVLLVFALKRRWGPVRQRWPHLLVGGALVHGLALATAHKALTSVAATPTALVHAFHPILTAALGVVLLGERFAWWQWLGVALGLLGVVLGVPHDADYSIMALLALSLFGLSGGTLYLKKFAADVPPFAATAVQLIGGALMALLMMVLFETPHVHWTASLAAAMTWNVVFMSIVGMAIYNVMMDRYGAAKAASGFFIVPGASALIAWAMINEHLRPIALIGLACATAGVVLVWWRPRFFVATTLGRRSAEQ